MLCIYIYIYIHTYIYTPDIFLVSPIALNQTLNTRCPLLHAIKSSFAELGNASILRILGFLKGDRR